MKALIEADQSFEKSHLLDRGIDQYYCVEIPAIKLGVIYQFKLWRMDSVSMFVLVRKDSRLLQWLQVGDRFNMKYYSSEIICSSENLDTMIQDIRWQEYGRLRGHFLIYLDIVDSRHQDRHHWAYSDERVHAVPYNA